jgi:hypothetical protein
MSFDEDVYLIIEGNPPNNTRIRPHNWAERFACNLASFGPSRRVCYSDAVVPVMIDGVKCLRIERSLEIAKPALFRDILAFAEQHGLKVRGLAVPSENLPLAS